MITMSVNGNLVTLRANKVDIRANRANFSRVTREKAMNSRF